MGAIGEWKVEVRALLYSFPLFFQFETHFRLFFRVVSHRCRRRCQVAVASRHQKEAHLHICKARCLPNFRPSLTRWHRMGSDFTKAFLILFNSFSGFY